MFVHSLDPVAFTIFGLDVRYYGIVYAFGLALSYWWLLRQVRRHQTMSVEQADSLFLWIVVGVLLGARFFEVAVYRPTWYAAHPSEILQVWHGGLSFHGGLVGAVLAAWIFSRKQGVSLLKIADVLVVPASLALGFGRLANFVNGELYGRITTMPWGVLFPQGGDVLRHPSQLYEAAKNFVLFGVLHRQERKTHRDGEIFALFLIMYGVLRFIVEFFREPEVMVWIFTMGQVLSSVMVLVGIFLYRRVRAVSSIS